MKRYSENPWRKIEENTYSVEDSSGTIICSLASAQDAKLIARAPEMAEMLALLKEAWLDGRMDDVEGILTGDALTDILDSLETHNG
jgi:hypothetical protein